MTYVSSYETGHQPFVPNLKRGYWSGANDFIYAGLSLGFRWDLFALSWIARVETGVGGFIPAYLLSLVLYVVPLLVVKSFMGQFSSSGFISSLRVCPLFKGIGYVTLFLNICALIYYSIFAMIPLVYLFASFSPTLPWSCKGVKEWTQKAVLFCNENGPCNEDCSRDIPSTLYFWNLFKTYTIFGKTISLSWHLILSCLGAWAFVGLIIAKLSTEKIGLLIRYTLWCSLAILFILIVHFTFLPFAGDHYKQMFSLNWTTFTWELSKIPVYGLCAFGPGWGLFISLASFNSFRTNVTRSSWFIAIGQMFIIMGLNMLEKFIHLSFSEPPYESYFLGLTQFRTFFMASGSAFAMTAWPNLWCILFYAMLAMASLVLMILQLQSILSSIFDEFVSFRQYRNCITFILISIMALFSLIFSTEAGFDFSPDIALDTVSSQCILNLLLILIVTWIYGRNRFQRDMTFMTGSNFATWKIYMLRFVAPIGILIVVFVVAFFSLVTLAMQIEPMTKFLLILKTIPWCLVPAFSIFALYRSKGSLKERLIKCCRPTDWYPVEADERQLYEKSVNASNITHPLSQIPWNTMEYGFPK